jgi:hypothetical protein
MPSTTAPNATNPPHIGLAYWQQITQRAEEAIAEHDDAGALGLFTLALREARALVQASLAPGAQHALAPSLFDGAIGALVASHHHLAELHRREGAAAEAEAHLCHAHETVRLLLGDAGLGPEWHAAARRQWHRTRSELLRFAAPPAAVH